MIVQDEAWKERRPGGDPVIVIHIPQLHLEQNKKKWA